MGRNTKLQKCTFIITGLFFLFYILGFFFPDFWWATHQLRFTSHTIQIGVVVLLLSILSSILIMPKALDYLGFLPDYKIKQNSFIILFLSIGIGLVFYNFPMVADFYGESYKINHMLNETVTTIPSGGWKTVFNYTFSPWAGQDSIFRFINWLTYFTGWNYLHSFVVFDALFGFLYIFSLLVFVNRQMRSNQGKVVTGILAISSPMLLNFFGHIEINAIVYFINLLWIILAINHSKFSPEKMPWTLMILLVFCLKVHSVALLFFPSLIILVLKSKNINLGWKKISIYLLLPIFIMGMVLYFIVLEDYKDPRDLTFAVMEYDRLFLPLLTPEVPLDKYNMLSFNHVFDYFQEILLWSPGGFMLLILAMVLYRKKIKWDAMEIKVSGVSLILFGSLFFVINPLLSMQMDWDLFAFPAPVFLCFSVLVASQLEPTRFIRLVSPGIVGLAILVIPFFTIHRDESQLSNHLISLGKRIYLTYYEWGSQTMNNGIRLKSQNKNDHFIFRGKVLRELKQNAVVGNDKEYAALNLSQAIFLFEEKKDFVSSLSYFKDAILYNPNNQDNLLFLMENYYELGEFSDGYAVSRKLLETSYPDQRTSVFNHIKAAIFAEEFEEALVYSDKYLENWNSPEYIYTIRDRLLKGGSSGGLKKFFSHSKNELVPKR